MIRHLQRRPFVGVACEIDSLCQRAELACFGADGGAKHESRMRLRNIKLTAGAEPVTLMDVRAYPELPATFGLVDDAGVCRSPHSPLGEKDVAVRLLPGEEYSVTVILDTADGLHRKFELPSSSRCSGRPIGSAFFTPFKAAHCAGKKAASCSSWSCLRCWYQAHLLVDRQKTRW